MLRVLIFSVLMLFSIVSFADDQPQNTKSQEDCDQYCLSKQQPKASSADQNASDVKSGKEPSSSQAPPNCDCDSIKQQAHEQNIL